MIPSPPILAAVLLFPLGACIGSFLNVVAYRLPRGMSLSHPPSHCPHCGLPISWRDNVPVFGWLLLRGRGRCCGQPISVRYPLVELVTGLLWSLLALHFARDHGFPPGNPPALSTVGLTLHSAGCMLVWQAFASVLIAISLIDLDERIIPHVLVFPAAAGGVLASVLLPGLHPDFVRLFPAVSPHLSAGLGAICGALAGGGALLAITLCGTALMRGKLRELQQESPEATSVIGYGDVFLMLAAGAFLGWQNVLVAIAIGSVYGAAAGLVMKFWTGNPQPTPESPEGGFWAGALRRWQTGMSVMPFGPFLSAGVLTSFFYGLPLLRYWLSLTFPDAA